MVGDVDYPDRAVAEAGWTWKDLGVGVPSGTVTFLFTDIEGSTRLWETTSAAMGVALERHNVMVRAAIEEAGGFVFATGGDGFAAAFARAGDGLAAASRAQEALEAEAWPDDALIKVRMAVHTGEVSERDGDYFGTPVNQVARMMALGHGGQILCSATTAALVAGQVPLLDLGEHRLRDLSAAQRVFQVGEGRFPALRSVDAVPGNLPTMLTELVGRSDDIVGLVRLLQHDRLVTLTGVGGVGKTRLALAVAAAMALDFPDGCWLAELAPAGSAAEVTGTVASALGVPATNVMALARYLAERRTLIVLDNCEHLLSDAADLAEAVLRAGPETVILATSREPLGVAGEVMRGVRSLTVPPSGGSVSEATDASAVRLFVARAPSAAEGFVLDEDNIESVVEICRHLDGIPLALELAAARVRGMSPAEIARRLGERFRLLAASRGSIERHRTLLGAVSWSHDLLSDQERVVFRRLGVFPASFDLAAAEAVAGEADHCIDVVDAVLHLVDRCLVVFDPTAQRYRLLETLRQFATDRLADAAETDQARQRHGEFYLHLAADQGDITSAGAFQRLDAEFDNLRAVAEWLEQQDRWADLLSMCRHLFEFLGSHALHDACGWYRAALDHLPDLDTQQRIDALGELEWIAGATGDYVRDALSGASIDLADSTGNLHSPWAWGAREQFHRMDPPDAKLAAERMLAVAQERGDRYATTTALGLLAIALAVLGDFDGSAQFAEQSLQTARLLSTPIALANAVATTAASYLTTRADPDFDSGMRILQDNPVDLDLVGERRAASMLLQRGLAHLCLGHTALALSHLIRSFRLADRIGFEVILPENLVAVAVALAEAGQVTLAWQLIGYDQAHFNDSRRFFLQKWLRVRLADVEKTTDTAGRGSAITAGARLDRRGFMRLITQAENSAEQMAGPEGLIPA
jgi:predicted ATPase/class 3 adenylate cyclase